MDQDTKGRTKLGTLPPVTQPRPVPTSRQHPVPPASAARLMTPPSAAPTMMPPSAAPTMMPPSAAPTMSDGNPDILIGQELCGYTIRRKLAEGGMGIVYEGVHTMIGRFGAIKVLKSELCRSEDVVERFYQEARAVNAIRHENIVDIYDFGRDPYGRVFFVMEYLDGEPLSARLRRGALSWSDGFPILEQTLRALKAAHDKGFVHRDLKPDNIWLKYVDGRVQVKLLDFGIAKLVGVDGAPERLTQTGAVIGTPHYMSPEQINGSKDIDQRTDIYALGVIIYELFAGVTPFIGDTLQAIMTGHLFKDPPRLADIPPNLRVPAPIAEIVAVMLAKDVAGRYASVADVLADLHDVNRNQVPANARTLTTVRPTRLPAAPGPSHAPPDQPRGIRPRTAMMVAALAVAGVVVASVAISRSQHPSPDPRVTPTTTVNTPPPVSPTPAEVRPLDHDAVRKDAQAVLRASLQQTEPAARVQGSDALGKVKDTPSVPALAALTERDPDHEVRGHAADALGMLGASATAQLLAKLEAGAPPPLKVWYASALARLGDKTAANRLLGYARSTDLAVSFKAGLTLADISQPGDRKTIAALKAIAAHEAELNNLAPYAGALILTKLAALRDPIARKTLYAILEHSDEGARLAAAEGLARLGDDAGKKVLQDVFANQASPNRLVAAVAQIALGEYGGLDVVTAGLDAKDPGVRRLAARAIGEIGERTSLAALIGLAHDPDWTVRIAAAAAIVAIVGLDPQVLAQASVDWTKGALESQDWAVRKAAAGVLADLPEPQALPLLAQAIADRDPKVRLAASKSAGRMKTADAAVKVAAAALVEKDDAVKEQQVKALGAIGNPAAHDTLAQISQESGRIGVFAAGSLIAIGDASGKAKLDAAVIAPESELRLAAAQAASAANNAIVVPTLKIAVLDKVFIVRFTAAEGLATFNAEKQAALPVLNDGLASNDADVIGRALAALTRLGQTVASNAPTPTELLDSPDPKRRLAAVPVIHTLPSVESVPLLRRLVADPDQDVRHAGVDAIEDVVTKDRAQAIKLYKPLVDDADPVVRSKASGQLARLVPPPPKVAAATAPVPAAAPGPAAVTDDPLPKVQVALDGVAAAVAKAKTETAAFDALAADLATITAAAPKDDTAIKRVEELETQLAEAAARLETTAAGIEAAANTASASAGVSSSQAAAKLVDEARQLAQGARSAATAARATATDAVQTARTYRKTWTADPQDLIDAANVAIAAASFADAQRNLDKAAKLLHASGRTNANLDYSYAYLYDRRAGDTRDPAAKHKLLRQAEDAYRRFTRAGAGTLLQRANTRMKEIADEIQELGQP